MRRFCCVPSPSAAPATAHAGSGKSPESDRPRLFLAMQKLERKKLIAPEKPVKEKSAKEKPADRIESTAEKKSARRTKRKKAAKRKKRTACS